MSSATITSKGQITIPVDVRNHPKVVAGDRIEFVLTAPGRYEFVAAKPHQWPTHDSFDAKALAYCLMGNHYHFVLQTRQATELRRPRTRRDSSYSSVHPHLMP